jgi:hypothetical protein
MLKFVTSIEPLLPVKRIHHYTAITDVQDGTDLLTYQRDL